MGTRRGRRPDGGDREGDRRLSFTVRAASLAAIVVLIAIAYANSLGNSFHFDDSHVIENNAFIRDLRNVPRFFTDASTFSSLPSNSTYRPLVSLTLALDYRLGGGLAPRAFHLTQIALMAILAVALVFFYRRVMDEGVPEEANWFAAVFTAALFAVHTANVETMNLISARSELIAAIGFIGAFLIYFAWPRLRWTHLFLVPVILGGLAKAPVAVFALALLLWKLLFERGEKRTSRLVVETLPSIGVCVALLVFLDRMNDPRWTSGGGDRLDYATTQAWVWLHYTRLFFLPVGLTADTDLSAIRWWDTRFLVGIALVAALLALFAYTARRVPLRPAAFGIGFYILGLLPASSFFPLAELANEHRVFFPFIGLALTVTWMAMRSMTSRRALAALAAVVLIANCAGTIVRNRDWRSEETLWRDVTVKSPMNGRGLMNYGLTLMARGDMHGALAYFNRAEALLPAYSTLQINLGIAQGALGKPAEAELHFRRALALADDQAGNFFYARWLVGQGRVPEAIPLLRRAMAVSTADLQSRTLLLRILALQKSPEAGQLATEILAIDGWDRVARAIAAGEAFVDGACATFDACFLQGWNALQRKDLLRSAEFYDRAVRLEPRSVGWNDYGWALLQLGLKQEARDAFAKAVAIDPANARARANLAAVQ